MKFISKRDKSYVKVVTAVYPEDDVALRCIVRGTISDLKAITATLENYIKNLDDWALNEKKRKKN